MNGIKSICERVGETVVGQHKAIERILVGLLCGGHVLLEGVPGLAKTLLVNSVARSFALSFARIQFTVDLQPSDVIGSEILNQSSGKLEARVGPVNKNFVLADEINRCAPRVQSALLEAMQERRVTIGTTTFELPKPFMVVGTQNPIEQSGTFELPEAQLDRFMICHRMDFPTEAEEQEIVKQCAAHEVSTDGGPTPRNHFDTLKDKPPVASMDLLGEMMIAVRNVKVSEVFRHRCVALVRSTRESSELEVACGPRASIDLVKAAQARAYVHGRNYVNTDDVFDLVHDVLLHRMRPTYRARAEGRPPKEILKTIVDDFVEKSR